MGKFTYGSSEYVVTMSDVELAHLQLVIATKLKVGEPFFVSWKSDASLGAGRSSLWISTAAIMRFDYDRVRVPAIDRELFAKMLDGSYGLGGLQLDDLDVDTSSPLKALAVRQAGMGRVSAQ